MLLLRPKTAKTGAHVPGSLFGITFKNIVSTSPVASQSLFPHVLALVITASATHSELVIALLVGRASFANFWNAKVRERMPENATAMVTATTAPVFVGTGTRARAVRSSCVQGTAAAGERATTVFASATLDSRDRLVSSRVVQLVATMRHAVDTIKAFATPLPELAVAWKVTKALAAHSRNAATNVRSTEPATRKPANATATTVGEATIVPCPNVPINVPERASVTRMVVVTVIEVSEASIVPRCFVRWATPRLEMILEWKSVLEKGVVFKANASATLATPALLALKDTVRTTALIMANALMEFANVAVDALVQIVRE